MKFTKIFKKGMAVLLLLTLLFSLSGCRTKELPKAKRGEFTGTELTVYNVFDNEDVFMPMLQAFKAEYGAIQVNYRKFNNIEEYREVILNELAEGEGPDIFFMHNSWFYQDHKKLLPAPKGVTVQAFKETYVDVVANDVIMKDDTGVENIYSFPLYVDTLALYYNRAHFNDKIPERGTPAKTWAALEEDVFKLKKEDNSFERFKVAGISLGRADNILRGVDILLAIMLQHGTQFYDENFRKAIFAESQGVSSIGLPRNPALDAVEFYTSFGLPTHRNYTWNSFLSNVDTSEKEIETFVRGKVSMIFGYSYLYEEIARQTEIMAKKYPNIIEMSDVSVAEIPQVYDPDTTVGESATLASYFAPVVARTTENPEAAWALISFITNQDNSRYYHDKTHRPTARRDLIAEQSEDPIYGVFAAQVGYAKTIPMVHPEKYELIFSDLVNQIIATVPPKTALKVAQDRINSLIPIDGLFPVNPEAVNAQ